MRRKIGFSAIGSIIFIISTFQPLAAATVNSNSPATIAILPFSMHTPPNLAYLQQGIRDMLASRLAWQGKVQIVERSLTEHAIQGIKSEISLADAARIGGALKADYVLFGSVTALGQSISIDAKVVSVGGKTEPLSLYAQTKSLDEVIPRINQFAQEVNQKLFSRATEGSRASLSEGDPATTRNPELLIPDAMQSTDKISYLNPNFLELTPEGSLRQPGLWRSQTFSGGIVGMDVGDLDGDGRQELVAATYNKLMVMRKDANALATLATFNGTKMDRFLWVSVADLDRDGKAEIYLTSMKRVHQLGSVNTDHVGYGRSEVEETSSFVLTFAGNTLNVVAKDQPYFLNAIDLPKKGKVLLGQQKADDSDGTFRPDIYEMQLRGGSLAQLTTLQVPNRCNVFNFAQADVNNTGNEEILLIDSDNRLLVLDPGASQIWKGRHRFAATSNYFIGKVEDLRWNMVDYYYIPSPILVSDLNSDNIKEIIVNRSPDYSRFMPEGLKTYGSGEIVSLSWDQMGMVENWKTRDVSGMVTAIRVGDLNQDGVPELIASLVLAKDFLKLWESQSTIFTYDLNISQTKSAKKP